MDAMVIKDGMEENQALLAGYLNFDFTRELRKYMAEESGPAVHAIFKRHNAYRNQKFGMAERVSRPGEPPDEDDESNARNRRDWEAARKKAGEERQRRERAANAGEESSEGEAGGAGGTRSGLGAGGGGWSAGGRKKRGLRPSRSFALCKTRPKTLPIMVPIEQLPLDI